LQLETRTKRVPWVTIGIQVLRAIIAAGKIVGTITLKGGRVALSALAKLSARLAGRAGYTRLFSSVRMPRIALHGSQRWTTTRNILRYTSKKVGNGILLGGGLTGTQYTIEAIVNALRKDINQVNPNPSKRYTDAELADILMSPEFQALKEEETKKIEEEVERRKALTKRLEDDLVKSEKEEDLHNLEMEEEHRKQQIAHEARIKVTENYIQREAERKDLREKWVKETRDLELKIEKMQKQSADVNISKEGREEINAEERKQNQNQDIEEEKVNKIKTGFIIFFGSMCCIIITIFCIRQSKELIKSLHL
jgi:hypothetical protein